MIIFTEKKFLGDAKILLTTELHIFFLGRIWDIEPVLCNQLRKTVNFNLFFEIWLTSKLSFQLKFRSICSLFFSTRLFLFLTFLVVFIRAIWYCESDLLIDTLSLSSDIFLQRRFNYETFINPQYGVVWVSALQGSVSCMLFHNLYYSLLMVWDLKIWCKCSLFARALDIIE